MAVRSGFGTLAFEAKAACAVTAPVGLLADIEKLFKVGAWNLRVLI
jgi:hypothetical protein